MKECIGMLLSALVCALVMAFTVSCSDSDDDSKESTDDDLDEPENCWSLCEKGLECAPDIFYQEYEGIEECVADCEANVDDPAVACAFECDTDMSCISWMGCIMDCANSA